METLSIIIPVFNEKNTILNLLNLIEKQVGIKKQILLVDDKSTDDSLHKIKNFDFKSDFNIIEHTINKGKGACIKTAKKHIFRSSYVSASYMLQCLMEETYIYEKIF